MRYGAVVAVVLLIAGMRALPSTERHEVEVVHDGAAGLAKIEDFRAEIVLLDIELPRMDGYRAALAGYGRDDDRNAALETGFDGHLAKPVGPRRLLRTVADEA